MTLTVTLGIETPFQCLHSHTSSAPCKPAVSRSTPAALAEHEVGDPKGLPWHHFQKDIAASESCIPTSEPRTQQGLSLTFLRAPQPFSSVASKDTDTHSEAKPALWEHRPTPSCCQGHRILSKADPSQGTSLSRLPEVLPLVLPPFTNPSDVGTPPDTPVCTLWPESPPSLT